MSIAISFSLCSSLRESGEAWPNWAGLRKPIISPAAPVTHGHQMWVQPQRNAESATLLFCSASLSALSLNKLAFVCMPPLCSKSTAAVHRRSHRSLNVMLCADNRQKQERDSEGRGAEGNQRAFRWTLRNFYGLFPLFLPNFLKQYVLWAQNVHFVSLTVFISGWLCICLILKRK